MKKLILAGIVSLAIPALAFASPILSTSAGTFATAQNINGSFSLNALVNVLDSTTIPHAEINQAGRPGGGFDYYAFTHSGGTVHLDIDTRTSGSWFDTWVVIWTGAGVLVNDNDDNGNDPGDIDQPGDVFFYNSGLFNMNLAAGTYVVGVCQYFCDIGPNGSMSNDIPQGGGYILNVSANSVPEPATIGLIGIGLAGLANRARRQRRKQ